MQTQSHTNNSHTLFHFPLFARFPIMSIWAFNNSSASYIQHHVCIQLKRERARAREKSQTLSIKSNKMPRTWTQIHKAYTRVYRRFFENIKNKIRKRSTARTHIRSLYRIFDDMYVRWSMCNGFPSILGVCVCDLCMFIPVHARVHFIDNKLSTLPLTGAKMSADLFKQFIFI